MIRKYKAILDVAVDSLKSLLSIIGHVEQILHIRNAFKTGRHQPMLVLAPKSKLEKAQEMFHREVVLLLSQIVVFFCKKTKYKAQSIKEREDTVA